MKNRKTWLVAGGAVLLILFGSIFLLAPAKTDVVNGITPVRLASANQIDILDRLDGLEPAEMKSLLDEEWPNLGLDLTAWLRHSGRIDADDQIEKLEFLYGDADATGEDAAGDLHEGQFRNELVAVLTFAGREPMYVAVKCSNGMFGLLNADLQPIGEGRLQFTISRGKSLVHYVSYATAIDLAETFGLPIYKGRRRPAKLISADEAREIDTDQHQVKVIVFTGDEFNLAAMTYNGNAPG